MLEPKRWATPKTVTVPLVKLLDEIKEAGFSKLEVWGYHLWDMHEDELSSLSEELKAREMTVPSIGSYLTSQGGSKERDILNVAERYFHLCEKFGSKRLRIFYGDRGFKECSEEYLDFIDKIVSRIFKMGEERSVQVMAEMHSNTVIDCREGLERVFDKFPEFRVVYQPYEFETEKALQAVEAVLGHIGSVHLQNRDKGNFTRLSEGNVDYRQVLERLSTSGYAGPFVLEFTAGIVSSDYKSALSSAAKDKEWLESMWREL